MSTSIAKVSVEGLEQVLLGGDLKSLSSEQRLSYYQRVCESVGLNALTQPFEYLTLNGKMVLYAKRACTDQLRQVHNVSLVVTARDKHDDMYVVTARASLPNGRTDESIGAVPLAGKRGEDLANAMMKAETKAKRRVTLAICGLSMLDELEVESVRAAEHARAPEPARSPRPVGEEPVDAAVDSALRGTAHEDEQAAHFKAHLVDLGKCSEGALVAWRDALMALMPSEQQMDLAWRSFQKRCAQLKVDPAQYTASKGE